MHLRCSSHIERKDSPKMASPKSISGVCLAVVMQFLVLQDVRTSTVYTSEVSLGQSEVVGWVFTGGSAFHRTKRDSNMMVEPEKSFITDAKCESELRRLCGMIGKDLDDLLILGCVQTFKV